MPLSPEEIEGKHFLMALRGYDKDQVDAFLRELAAEQQALLHSADAAREAPEASGSRTGRDPFEGFAAQLESILRHAAEQAGTIRAAAEQEAAAARRELENARSVVARAERQAAAAAEQDARAAARLEGAEQEAAELLEAAKQEAAELLEAAKREAAEVRDAADRERQHSANVLEAAEEELRAALQLRAEREQELGIGPVTRPSNQPQPGAHVDRGDPSRATPVWFPFADD